MKDGYGREISYMRISITEKCNLSCTYCMGNYEQQTGDGKAKSNKEMSVEEIVEIVEAAVVCGIRKFRITGGEPLVRTDIIEICRRIHAVAGVEELTLTTNGILLEKYAYALKEAGVSRLNISLDTLKADKYRLITKNGNVKAVFQGIEAAKKAGLLPIKINVVLLKDFNEDEILDFVSLTREQPIEIRFIELMPIGEGKNMGAQNYMTAEEILRKVPTLKHIKEDGVAQLYQLPEGIGKVGLIRPVSNHFCSGCNRIRLTFDGKIKPCLHCEEEIDIRCLHGVELIQALKKAILQKPMKHEDFSQGRVSCSVRGMYQIGG